MVSQKTIKGLEFDALEDYFEYIISSKVNGQRKQAQKLYKDLSAIQKQAFRNWFDTSYYYDALDNETNSQNELNELLNYLEN